MLLIALNKKVDEILHAVNPNLPTKIYFCNGGWRSEGPGPNVGNQEVIDFSPDSSVDEMAKLADAGQYKELLKLCTAQIEAKPEWLTPRLLCALAYEGMGNRTEAKGMLDTYDARKGPAYDGDGFCKQVSDFAHAQLK